MNESASSQKVCGRCGVSLPANAPEGLCPRCLGALNLTGDTVFTETEAPRIPPPSPEQIAAHFPQLEILECLGRGGMGVVYKARQKSLGRFVALKLLAPEREKNPQFAERFAREAQALAQLNHPHIVTVYDFGRTNGFFYLLMEFVDGVNLRELLRARKLTPKEALAIVPPLCEALQFAHERGIVHRDIKPENLLLDKAGQVKVADFGIAKMLGGEASAAEENIAGTPGYMAPEQKATPQQADNRADIYSLGVVFYEMLTGELPTQKLERPSRKVAVDVRIDEVVLRALEKSPELRWQTAAELGTRVETIASGAPARSWHPQRQRTFWFLALPSAVALLGVNIVILDLFAPGMTAVHSYGFGPNWGLLLLNANALCLCASLDGAVMRSLWEWAHTAPALPTCIWLATRLWWAVTTCCLLLPIFLLLTSVVSSPLAPPAVVPVENPEDPQPTSTTPQAGPGLPPPAAQPAPQLTPTAAQPSLANPAPGTPSLQATPITPEPAVAAPESRVPVLSDIPILGRLFTKSAPDLSSREAAQRELLRMEQEMLTLRDHLRRGVLPEADYQKAEAAVQVMRRSLEATDEELKRTPITPTELKQRIDSELFKRGLIEPSAPATDAARIRLRAAENELKRASAQRDQGLISTAEYEAAATQFKLADAELRGDRASAVQVRLNAAAKTLARATVQRDQGIISNAEYEKAALALELARAEERASAAQTPARAPAATDTAGIGVALKEEGGHFVIGSILPGSPAANEGSLNPGHEIREIGDSGDQLVSIAGWKLEDVVARLRGKEGTQVSLFVVRSRVGTIVTLIRRKLPELELGREHPKTAERINLSATDSPADITLLTSGNVPIAGLSITAGEAALKNREKARQSLEQMERDLEALGQRLIRREISGDDFRNAERAVEAMRHTVKALNENPNFVTLPSGFGEKPQNTQQSVSGLKAAPTPWELRRYADGGTGTENDLARFPILWVPSEPPMIVASQGQKLTAFRAGKDGGEIAWQSHLDAAICSAPAGAAKLSRIYFGTADNQLHVLDDHGRRRWSFAAGGKAVTQSVVSNNMVVFGCDNRQVYGLDAETGAAKWTFGASASATSAPAIAAGLVLIGSTDGFAFALDPQTGDKKWSYEGTNSIYAPILGAGDLVYLATSGGEVVALDSKTGDTRWTAKLGGTIEMAMAIGSDRLFVVAGGRVSAMDLVSGKLMWQTESEEYVGAPLVFDNSLMITRRQGAVRRLDFAGLFREEWTVGSSDYKDADVSFRFGPVAGEGALWLSDEKGAVWRLGPGESATRTDENEKRSGTFNPSIGQRY